ncbi:MAG: gamma-glutamylcyclotransferase [Desulfovibrio sp.]|nr:MAG: gamma-glutamylcyclotransferase [Desulfovibrio sp.]
MQTHLVFVYGTLRQGFSNHGLMHGARFLGAARTKESFALYCETIPYVCTKTRVSPIIGEVYEVDSALLAALDRLEEHPRWYERRPARILLNDSGQEMTAWCYFNDHPRGVLVPCGDFADAARASDRDVARVVAKGAGG